MLNCSGPAQTCGPPASASESVGIIRVSHLWLPRGISLEGKSLTDTCSVTTRRSKNCMVLQVMGLRTGRLGFPAKVAQLCSDSIISGSPLGTLSFCIVSVFLPFHCFQPSSYPDLSALTCEQGPSGLKVKNEGQGPPVQAPSGTIIFSLLLTLNLLRMPCKT